MGCLGLTRNVVDEVAAARNVELKEDENRIEPRIGLFRRVDRRRNTAEEDKKRGERMKGKKERKKERDEVVYSTGLH